MDHAFEETALDIWQAVTARPSLELAWSKVYANQGSAGGDGVTLSDFGSDLYGNIMQLRAELLAGTYRAGPFRKVAVRKRKPGYRILTIPCVRDRVVHTSIANAIGPICEARFQDCSFAYRPNRGVVQAVARIEQWRSRGYEVVIEADIVSYFDNIDHGILRSKLSEALGSLPGAAPVLALIDAIILEQGAALSTPGAGLAQGSPLSPLLANLYLDALDEAIDGDGVKLVRFADDFVVLCKSRRKAEEALAHCKQILAAHNLELHSEATRIVSFDKGFDFIGYLFLKALSIKERRLPEPDPTTGDLKHPIDEQGVIALEAEGARFDPGKRVLYLIDPSHSLNRRNRSQCSKRG